MKRPKILRTIVIVGCFGVYAAACGHYNTEEMEGSRIVTVTGCVQTFSGNSNIVLANVGAKQGAAPAETQTYRLEADRDLKEFIGKQIQVHGELTATLDDSDSGKAAKVPGDQLEFDDLAVLRVQSLDQIDETCGASFDNRVLGQFNDRVEQYVDVRNRALETVQQRMETVPPLAQRERALREQIQALRTDAEPGDLLTAETSVLFRRLLSVPLKGREASENIAAIRDDNPDAFVPTVNSQYPQTEPLSTVPPDVLRVLPRLPYGVQYRFIPGYLLLYDTRADMIIDYMIYTLRVE